METATTDAGRLARGAENSSWLRPEFRIVLHYLVFAGLWIFFSDLAVERLVSDPSLRSVLQTSKGWAFVILTALLLHWQLRMVFAQRRRAEAASQESHERFAVVARATSDVIWDWNLKTDQLWWSDGVQTLLGYRREDVPSDLDWWTRHIAPEDRERVNKSLQEAVEKHQHIWVEEYRFRRADGTFAWIYDRGFVLCDRGGRPVRMIGGMTDISERHRAEERLRGSEKQLRALTARLESLREEERTRISREIHDELGQMLTGLKMDLRWIEKRLGAAAGGETLNPILDRLVSASDLTDATIATVQKIAAELRPGVLDNIGLATALQYEASQFQKRTGIACSVRLPDTSNLPRTDADTPLFRIFQETLTNVARHAQATSVDVELKVGSDEFVLEVRDNGKGITTEDLANPKSLGLLGMRERASLLGGQISFKASTERGTVVTVRVPRQSVGANGKVMA